VKTITFIEHVDGDTDFETVDINLDDVAKIRSLRIEWIKYTMREDVDFDPLPFDEWVFETHTVMCRHIDRGIELHIYQEDTMVFDWVKRLGQWHLYTTESDGTLCGAPMLGNNYAKMIPVGERKKCPKCHGLGEDRL
jgi:hypothetical protein